MNLYLNRLTGRVSLNNNFSKISAFFIIKKFNNSCKFIKNTILEYVKALGIN